MTAVPPLDLQPLQRPLGSDEIADARRWVREAGQTDPRARLLRWVLFPLAAMMLGLVAFGIASADAEMAIVSGVLGTVLVAILVWTFVHAAGSMRTHAKLLAFARRNALGYQARGVDHRSSALVLQSGADRIVEHALLGGSAMMGGFRMREGYGNQPWLRWGFLTMIGKRQPGRVVAVPLPEVGGRTTTPVTWRLAQEDLVRAAQQGLEAREDRLPGWSLAISSEHAADPERPFAPRIPAGLLERLEREQRPLALDISGTGITVLAERGWDLADPATQRLIHDLRVLVAASGAQPAEAATFFGDHASIAALAASGGVVSFGDPQDAASRARRRRRVLWGALSVLGLVACVFVAALVRSLS